LPRAEKIPGLDCKQNFPPKASSALLIALLIPLLRAIALSCLAPEKRLIGPLPERYRMNIFEELKPQIDAFKTTRDDVVDSVSLPPTYEGKSCGEPPFAVDDGTSCYAVINAEGKASPLPFGYRVADEDIENDGVDFFASGPMAMSCKGMGIARYIPLVKDFEAPNNRAFCLETAEDSRAWELIGETVEAMQQVLSDKALSTFNQRLSFTILRFYERFEELESVDHAIAAIFQSESMLMALFFGSYQHALEAIEEELAAEGDDDDE
jgi:hypothetical protein